jgi:hypothetical protein
MFKPNQEFPPDHYTMVVPGIWRGLRDEPLWYCCEECGLRVRFPKYLQKDLRANLEKIYGTYRVKCPDCVEICLGRKLLIEDFNDRPVNKDLIKSLTGARYVRGTQLKCMLKPEVWEVQGHTKNSQGCIILYELYDVHNDRTVKAKVDYIETLFRVHRIQDGLELYI